MLKADYHVHTRLSYDGEGDLLEYCAKAEELGLDELCVTDHLDIGCAQMEFNPHDQKIYLEQFENARRHFPQLELRLGMEIGYRPDTHVESAMFISALPLDFVINSIHEINDVDPYYGGYFEGKTREEAYFEYLEQVLDSLDAAYPFNVLGHIGYPARYAPYLCSSIEYREFPELIDAILLRAIYDGKGIEVNTSTVRQLGKTMPALSIIKRYRELGGEFITIGSDAHTPARLGANFNDAEALLKELGFRYTTSYQEFKPVQRPID